MKRSRKINLKDYVTMKRWISYAYQIRSIEETNPKSVLEIGKGDGSVTAILKNRGYKVATFDFDENLDPDYVGDVRSLPFKDDQFEAISICQVLEHIPFEDIDLALSELARVAKKRVVCSLPYSSLNLSLTLSFTGIKKLFKKEFLHLSLGFPSSIKKKSKKHFWEIGWRGYPLSRVRKKLRSRFDIISEFKAMPNHYHHFFILSPK